jgi:Protein of unknown function (DUF3108)
MKYHHFLLPGLAAGLLASSPAWAAGGAAEDQPSQPGAQLQVALTLYAGGIGFGKMDLDATFRGADYHAVSNFQTSGAVSAFWQSEIQATSSGKIAGKGLAPALYDSFDINRTGRRQEVSLTYENGSPRLYADPVYSTTGYEVKAEDQKNTLDPLSAVTLIASGVGSDAVNPCAISMPVFDGRRLYTITMTKVKDTDIKMDNGLYAGKAVQCQIRYKPLAGMKPRVLKAGEDFPVINAWIVRYPSSIAGRAFAVPVRVWADTRYGQLSVVANSVKIDGQTPKSN